jgi:class 3 adenylate cyclase/tetratricopeptide (TPR) repeat protein
MENLNAYISEDRRRALAKGGKLPGKARGAALFADVSGFTALTEELTGLYGAQRGAEEIARHLNRVYDALIGPIERFGGNIIGFSGDAMTCWFDRDDGSRALASAFEIHEVMIDLANIKVSEERTVKLRVKVAVSVGPVRRFVVGDPTIRYMDVMAGETMERLATAEEQAKDGEVVMDAVSAKGLGRAIRIREWRTSKDRRFAVVDRINPKFMPKAQRVIISTELDDDQLRPWIIPAVYERMKRGQGEFLAELRSAVPVFAGFGGIDYDNERKAGEKLDAYVRWAQKIFAKYDGTLFELVIGEKGSYLYGAFGAPTAHDDDTLRAVAAAQELRIPPPELGYVSDIRIGISRGRMRAGPYGSTRRRSYSVIGDETNLAARLMQRAKPGQIIVSERVARAIEGRFHLKSLGAVKIKGKKDATNIFALLQTHAPILRPTRTLTNLVGRGKERQLLQEQIDRLVQERQGATIIIEGEAGIGKSRLVDELIERSRNSGATCFLGAGDAIDQATLYHAWKPVFMQMVDLHDASGSTGRRRKRLLNWMREAGKDLEELAPLFSVITPVDLPDNERTSLLSGQVRAETTREFLSRIVEHKMKSTPMVIVLEDAHWLDSASWALAARIAALSSSLILVLVTRPLEERAPQEFQAIASTPNTKRLTLGPLEGDAAIELVKQRLGVVDLPEAVVSLIQEKAEGNPFFSEELAYALRDAGLILVQDGICKLAPGTDLAKMNFPYKVEDVITSRIDLLSPTQRLALKVASVIGRIFVYQMLCEIHPVRADVPRLLDDLTVLSKVDLTPLETPEPELSYMFKHIITQEVAYNLMLFTQRVALHQRIGEWYEQNHAEDLANHYPTLAYHWSKVAETADADPAVIAKAIQYLFHAAEQAVGNYANPEATRHLQQALTLLNRLPASAERDQQELGMQAMLAYSLVTQRGYGDPEVEQAYRRANELSEKLPGSPRLGFILYGMFSFYASRAEYEEARQLADRLVEIGETFDDEPIRAVGYQSQAIVAFCSGDIQRGLEYAQKSYDTAAPLDSAAFFQFGGDFQAYTSAWLAMSQLLAGYPDRAQKTYEDALESTQQQPYPHGFILGFAGLPQLKHDMNEVFRRSEELIGLSQRYSFTLLGLQGNIFRAWASAVAQKDPVGIQILENITPVPRMVKLDSFVTWYLALLAEGQSVHGQHEAAMHSIDEALAYALRAGGNFYQAELYRLKGDILRAQGVAAGLVEEQYRQAIDCAQEQNAKWWELRASTSLASLLQEQNKLAEARDLLEPILKWFEEGAGNADLQKARALLSELS